MNIWKGGIIFKKYDQAVKNKDLNCCNTLPLKDKQKCIKKILIK